MSRKIKKYKAGLPYFMLVLPALTLFSIFVIYPAFSTIVHSFTNWSDVVPTNYKFVALRNYIKLFKDGSVLIGIRNSFVYAIFATLFQGVVGLSLALVLNRAFKTKNILRAVWYFPAVLSSLIVGFLWNYILSTSDYGLINSLLAAIGVDKVNFLGNPRNALTCIIVVSVWQWSGWIMTIYLANLQSIPDDLYESAAIDGASPWKRFMYITVPMLFPSVSYTFITGMISGLKVFDMIYALTNGGPNGQTESIISLMMKKGFTEGFYSYACAMGTVFMIIVLIITMFQMKFFNNWGDNIS